MDYLTLHTAQNEEIYLLPQECSVINDSMFNKIIEGCSMPKDNIPIATSPRANSSQKTRNKIMTAANSIVEICNNADVEIRLDSLPGTKNQFLHCLILLDPTINMSESTFDGKAYVDKLPLAWKRGNKSSGGLPMFRAIEDYVAA